MRARRLTRYEGNDLHEQDRDKNHGVVILRNLLNVAMFQGTGE